MATAVAPQEVDNPYSVLPTLLYPSFVLLILALYSAWVVFFKYFDPLRGLVRRFRKFRKSAEV